MDARDRLHARHRRVCDAGAKVHCGDFYSMTTLNPDTVSEIKIEMRWAWEDAMDTLAGDYGNIAFLYERKYRVERSNSQWTHGYFHNTELCMCA